MTVYKSPYASSSISSNNDLYQASLKIKNQIYVDRYNKRETTPYASKYSSLYCYSAPGWLKPKEIPAREIHENDPFNKGPLLTYLCIPCNQRHYFHKGDVIVSNGENYYTSGDSEEESPLMKRDTASTGGSDLSSIGSGSIPIINFSLKEYVCCADDRCARPQGLTATVLCYDCHDDFHQNLCGVVVDVLDNHKQCTIARHICHKCANLCNVGREDCKHPGDTSGLVQCSNCKANFHADGCGWKAIGVASGEWPSNERYKCNHCVDRVLRLSRHVQHSWTGRNKKMRKYIKDVCVDKENKNNVQV
jgi:hypothetical protein